MAGKITLVAFVALIAVNAGAVGGLYYFTDFFDEPEEPNINTTVTAILEIKFNITDGDTQGREFQRTITTNMSTVLGQLEAAKMDYNFDVVTDSSYSSLGILVTSIDGVANNDTYAWIYYLNWEMGGVGADSQPLTNDDVVTWIYQKDPYA